MKKIFLLLTASVAIISCSKVKDGEYLITGTAKGIENGKTIILQGLDPKTQMTVALDTVKVENGKFEIKGKVAEPAFHTLIIQDVQGIVPFILETGEINIAVDKDSIQNTKISGTYNNDEYVKFDAELKVATKKLVDFQKKNTQTMQAAQQKQDTAVINGLMKEFMAIQTEVQAETKKKYVSYAEGHPKSFISALILQGMAGDPTADVKKIETLYNSLDESVKNTTPGKKVKESLGKMKMPSVGASAAPVGDAK